MLAARRLETVVTLVRGVAVIFGWQLHDEWWEDNTDDDDAADDDDDTSLRTFPL